MYVKLEEDLLKTYNEDYRPVKNDSTIVDVSVLIEIMHLYSVVSLMVRLFCSVVIRLWNTGK